jgi:hypothetical protein
MTVDFIYFFLSNPKGQFLISLHPAPLSEIFETISGAGGVVNLVSWSTNLVRSAYLSFLPLPPHSLSVPCPYSFRRGTIFAALVLLLNRAVQHDKIAFPTLSDNEDGNVNAVDLSLFMQTFVQSANVSKV